MSASDWQQFLASPEYLGEFYDVPPSPDLCDLFYVHIDERGNSITFGFDTKKFPSRPRGEWQEKGLNAFEFYLVFTDVEDLRVSGWGPPVVKEFEFTWRESGQVAVAITGEGSEIAFCATSVFMAKTRAYLAQVSE
ncbi:Imm50 family immunity protein [Streptomyces sp. AC602_WCS936]|uniref:Imm50 family immunity protein n=1 Tax=Streptomyces sp. AC602_WCS936 TaxID=2823685 RepID=UPI001C255555|nr:Imm50 family immunity protein [Streptomyces sp. AC602_WCS936]